MVNNNQSQTSRYSLHRNSSILSNRCRLTWHVDENTACRTKRKFPQPLHLRPSRHFTWIIDDSVGSNASWRWISKLHCASPDRRKRLGISTFKRYKLLDIPIQRSTPCRLSISSRRHSKHRLDTLRSPKHYTVHPSTRSNTCHLGTGIIRRLRNHVLNQLYHNHREKPS